MADAAIKPFHNPDLRELLETLRRDTDQLIDDSADELLEAGYDAEKAQGIITRYESFIKEHKDELDAIQLIYAKPYTQRHLSYQQIEDLADEIKQPPYNIAPLEVWKAYEQLEKAKVKGVPAKELLTNIVSLIRFSTGLSEVLEPFPELVNQRFEAWLEQQSQARHSREGGNPFTVEQQQWLQRIKDQIANNAEFEMDDFEMIPACKEEGAC
ncbi:type I restriction-modification enzyme R subunit C-terminal domain-containing protein [Oceanicoccus sp. KOV_DT_Chl]|uniref:type I restriction-modification enzyme R subunit C-terminal domain-containing protein n=1 Tax=Oceanicoccus sp. KOV_DT_Chl TaxID=1904639 RepID=UPI00190EDB73|nr:type I restriction-modification enzyme R subunit C-terminal domain-containing protein [Oceanicoccus sp. KOV_DT_Chl]